MSHLVTHVVKDGRQPGTERCTECSWQFPCPRAEATPDCGHLDCIDFHRELPRCYHCGQQVEGHPAGAAMPSSAFAPIAAADDDGTWTIWRVHGVTRAVHYACRDASKEAT